MDKDSNLQETVTQGSVEVSLDIKGRDGKKAGNIKFKGVHLVNESKEDFSKRLEYYKAEAIRLGM